MAASGAPNLLISVPLGLSTLQTPPQSPAGCCPCTRGWRSLEVESSVHPLIPPPLPGADSQQIHSSPPLPPPRLPSSKSFHPRQLQEEVNALQPRCRSSGSGSGWTRGTGGWTAPGGWTVRSYSLPLLGLGLTRPGPLSPCAAGCTIAQRRHRRVATASALPLPPSLQPHHVGVRILHPFSFPFPLFWKREVEGGNKAAKERPACKVLL